MYFPCRGRLYYFSSMSCVVNNGLSSNIRAFGTVRLPISFNVGGTGSSVNIQDSKCFTAGTNTVTFTDGDHKISTTVNFLRLHNHLVAWFISQGLFQVLINYLVLLLLLSVLLDMHPVCSDFQQQKMM